MTLLDDIYGYIGKPKNELCAADLSNVQMSTNAVLEALRSYTGRYLTQANWQDTFTFAYSDYMRSAPMRHRTLSLSEYPVSAVTQVTWGGNIIDPLYYRVDAESGLLQQFRGGSYWDFWVWDGTPYGTSGWDDIVVAYTAGYDPLPADLLLLVTDFVSGRLAASQAKGQFAGAIPGDVQNVEIAGVGKVGFRSSYGSGVVSGFNVASAVAGGPILGAGIAIADLYRDLKKFIRPETNIISQRV